jgi:hypothetical protein
MTNFYYFAQKFQQSKNGLSALLFLAPAEEITTWGAPPQKSSKFMKGYQRAAEDSRVTAIAEYFEKGVNISPTAIVVAFKPAALEIVSIDPKLYPDMVTDERVNVFEEKEIVLVKVAYDEAELEGLTCIELAKRVRSEIGKTIPADDSPVGDAEDDEQEQEDTEAGGNNEGGKGIVLSKSHLGEFLEFLGDMDALARAEEEDRDMLRTMLKALLVPGTIVDGQHRAAGAGHLEQCIPFPVVALIDAEWHEQVFQFVVINQKSSPIPSEFLSSIISSSLTNQEIEKLQARLEEADIEIDDAVIMDSIQFDERSPFKEMVNFKVEGQTGYLSYPGILGLAKRFKKLRTHAGKEQKVTFSRYFKGVFQHAMTNTANYSERRQKWQSEEWFTYFCLLWDALREKFAISSQKSVLWEENSNLLKIVTLQEMQNMFLLWLYDRMDEVKTPDDFKGYVDKYFAKMDPSFFLQPWKLTSLQSPTGREHLRIAINNAVKSAGYAHDDALFLGLSKGSQRA